jgi:hypothetical protein
MMIEQQIRHCGLSSLIILFSGVGISKFTVIQSLKKKEEKMIISDAVKQCKKLRLTKWGEIKLSAYPDDIIHHAYSRLLTKTDLRDPLDFFFMVCSAECKDRKIKPNWKKVDFAREAYKIPLDAPLQFPLKSADEINSQPSETVCSTCHNTHKACQCGTRSDNIGCVCSTFPSRACRGFERLNWKRYHPVAAYEHFEKFKNPKGLKFLGKPETYNPFKEDYEEYQNEYDTNNSV